MTGPGFSFANSGPLFFAVVLADAPGRIPPVRARMVETDHVSIRVVEIGFTPQPRLIPRLRIERNSFPLQLLHKCVELLTLKINHDSRAFPAPVPHEEAKTSPRRQGIRTAHNPEVHPRFVATPAAGKIRQPLSHSSRAWSLDLSSSNSTFLRSHTPQICQGIRCDQALPGGYPTCASPDL